MFYEGFPSTLSGIHIIILFSLNTGSIVNRLLIDNEYIVKSVEKILVKPHLLLCMLAKYTKWVQIVTVFNHVVKYPYILSTSTGRIGFAAFSDWMSPHIHLLSSFGNEIILSQSMAQVYLLYFAFFGTLITCYIKLLLFYAFRI